MRGIVRRYIGLLLVFSLAVFCLAGCGGQKGDRAKDLNLRRAGQVPYGGNMITVGFIQNGNESDWREANSQNFKAVFSEEKGYHFIYVNGNSSQERQIKAMYDLIAQGVDYIILNPVARDGWEDVLEEAKENKIPVIISGGSVSADESLFACRVGADFEKEGVNACKAIEIFLEGKELEDEPVRIALIEGLEGSPSATGRTGGIEKEAAAHDNWQITVRERGDFTQGGGRDAMERILESGAEFEVLIAENDNMMFGAMAAMDQRGVSYGADKGVITVSFEAVRDAFKKMQKKQLVISVESSPLLARNCEEAILAIDKKKEYKKVIYTQEMVFFYDEANMHIDSRTY